MPKLDETIQGGRYLVGGLWVDANGAPIAAPSEQPAPSTDPLAKWPQLAAAGYGTVDAVSAATDEQLLAIDGIGEAKLTKIREVAAKK